VGYGDSNQSQSFPNILGWALWSCLHYIPVISRGLQEFKSIFTKKFPEKNFHSKRLHMIKSNEMASIVGHCENCLYDIKVKIEKNGSADQKEALADSMEALERLYFLLQEEE
jgi:hypothetical protein